MDFGIVALIALNNCFRLFRGSSALRRGVGCRLHALERGAVSEALNIGNPPRLSALPAYPDAGAGGRAHSEYLMKASPAFTVKYIKGCSMGM